MWIYMDTASTIIEKLQFIAQFCIMLSGRAEPLFNGADSVRREYTWPGLEQSEKLNASVWILDLFQCVAKRVDEVARKFVNVVAANVLDNRVHEIEIGQFPGWSNCSDFLFNNANQGLKGMAVLVCDGRQIINDGFGIEVKLVQC